MTLPTLTQVKAELARRSFGDYVEQTSGIKLHSWQWILCNRLEKLLDQKGQRILIHAPPQHGKSLLVSQRFPLWLLSQRPNHRYIQAAYNQTKSCEFSDALRNVASMPEHLNAFPGASIGTPDRSEAWNIVTTTRIAEAQYNYRAVGILSGLTGSGGDTVSIDDPYASPEEAESPTINAKTIRFYDNSVKPRINDDTNVIVTFHRYHNADLAAHLLESDRWEMMHFPAEATDSPHDPTGRSKGEVLSPIRSQAFYDEIKLEDPQMWFSLFQGEPKIEGAGLFKEDYFEFIELDEAPDLAVKFRGWDTASKAKESSDPTATVKFGVDHTGTPIVFDAWWERMEWPELCEEFEEQAIRDTADTEQCIEDASSGIQLIYEMTSTVLRPRMAGFTIHSVGVKGRDLKQRIKPVATRARLKKIKVVKFGKHKEFVNCLCAFTGIVDVMDDPVAAFATAWEIAFQEEGTEKSDGTKERLKRKHGLS